MPMSVVHVLAVARDDGGAIRVDDVVAGAAADLLVRDAEAADLVVPGRSVHGSRSGGEDEAELRQPVVARPVRADQMEALARAAAERREDDPAASGAPRRRDALRERSRATRSGRADHQLRLSPYIDEAVAARRPVERPAAGEEALDSRRARDEDAPLVLERDIWAGGRPHEDSGDADVE